MKPSELASNLPLGPHPPKDVRTYIGVALGYLAENLYTSTLESGAHLLDNLDFKAFLRECGEAINLNDFCPRCGHVHQGRECGEEIGGGRVCRCELEGVPA